MSIKININNINFDYVKKGWDTNSKFKAVLHKVNELPKPYFTLRDLKERNPKFEKLHKILIDHNGEFEEEI